MNRAVHITSLIVTRRHEDGQRWRTDVYDCDGEAEFDDAEALRDPEHGSYAQTGTGYGYDAACPACRSTEPCVQRSIVYPATNTAHIVHEYEQERPQ